MITFNAISNSWWNNWMFIYFFLEFAREINQLGALPCREMLIFVVIFSESIKLPKIENQNSINEPNSVSEFSIIGFHVNIYGICRHFTMSAKKNDQNVFKKLTRNCWPFLCIFRSQLRENHPKSANFVLCFEFSSATNKKTNHLKTPTIQHFVHIGINLLARWLRIASSNRTKWETIWKRAFCHCFE